jgi:hypothetical protein
VGGTETEFLITDDPAAATDPVAAAAARGVPDIVVAATVPGAADDIVVRLLPAGEGTTGLSPDCFMLSCDNIVLDEGWFAGEGATT